MPSQHAIRHMSRARLAAQKPASPKRSANLAHAGTVLPPIHLERPQCGFCVLAAGISVPGGISLAASTENVPQAASRWIGGKQKHIVFAPSLYATHDASAQMKAFINLKSVFCHNEILVFKHTYFFAEIRKILCMFVLN